MEPTTAKLRYHGTGGSLFGIMFANAILTVFTLGIYSAWAKNKVRQFHWSHTEMDGDRFAYHGTGGELFRGYMLAGLVMIAAAFALTLASEAIGGDNASIAAMLSVYAAFYIGLFVLIVYAINSARRYRLSRSSWRGVRFSFHGDGADFLKLMTRGTLLSLVTLSLYNPSFQNQRRAFFVQNARFGSEPFMYDGRYEPLFREYLKALLLTIPTLGLYWFWYAAYKHRHFWNHTAMRGARFQCTITGGSLFALHATNLLLVLFTGGIAAPWAITRMHSFFCDNVSLVGTVDWASIQQRAQQARTVGEGVAETFDVDVGLGM
ncbi:MAG: YjgN family protein [Gemmatimonadota bacterium]|nr:YjgN family protein [Gemmatimonadota bacterium]